MCEPTTILAGATLAAGALSAYNQYETGKYSAAVAEQNADVAEAQAQDSINRGNARAEEVRRRNRQAAGTQAATMVPPALTSQPVTLWISSEIPLSSARWML